MTENDLIFQVILENIFDTELNDEKLMFPASL